MNKRQKMPFEDWKEEVLNLLQKDDYLSTKQVRDAGISKGLPYKHWHSYREALQHLVQENRVVLISAGGRQLYAAK